VKLPRLRLSVPSTLHPHLPNLRDSPSSVLGRRCTTALSQLISRSNSSKLDTPPSLLSLPIPLPILQPSSFPKMHSSLPLQAKACATISTLSKTLSRPPPALRNPVDELQFLLKKCVPLSTNSLPSSPLLRHLLPRFNSHQLSFPLLHHRISTLAHDDLTASKLLVKLDTLQRPHATPGSSSFTHRSNLTLICSSSHVDELTKDSLIHIFSFPMK